MPVIKIANVGGIAPSVLPRNLAPEKAQIAENLQARTTEFRPLPEHKQVASTKFALTANSTIAINNPKTILRMSYDDKGNLITDPGQGWRGAADVVNVVKSPVDTRDKNGRPTDRHYFTLADGSSPPRAFDARYNDRLLGVPAPKTKPTCTVVDNYTFTAEKKATETATALANAIKAVTDSLTTSLEHGVGGYALPKGWINEIDLNPTGAEAGLHVLRVFAVNPTTNELIDTYSDVPLSEAAWVLGLPGDYAEKPAKFNLPDWAASHSKWWCVRFRAYARVADVDEAGLSTALQGVKTPGLQDQEQWLTKGEADAMAARVAKKFDQDYPEVKGLVSTLKSTQEAATSFFNLGAAATTVADVKTFFNVHAGERIATAKEIFVDSAQRELRTLARYRVSGQLETDYVAGTYGQDDGTAVRQAVESALNANITAASDGGFLLNVQGFFELVSKFVNDAVQEAKPTIADRDAAWVYWNSVEPALITRVNNLASLMRPDAWKNHPDFPHTTTIPTSPSFLNGVANAKSAAEDAAKAIDRHYENLNSKVATIIETVYTELNLEAKVPQTEERRPTPYYYIYTYVTDWGEESAPSPVSDMVEADQNDTVKITIDPAPPDRHIKYWRFYRSAAGSTMAAFQFIAEGDITVTEGENDPRSPLGEVCPTLTWMEPPTNLRGLTGMQNGVMAGFYDNVVCFCEPYVPYAWPLEYQITVAYPIVAMASFGQTLVVAHHGGIDYITGADSASMSAQKDVSKQTCVSARSMHPVEGGVVFASPDGLCLANSQGVQVLTKDLLSRESWQALNPAAMIGSYHERTYYFSAPSKASFYALHLETGKLVTIPGTASAFYHDVLTDTLYLANGDSISAMFGGTDWRVGKWRSKKFVLPSQASFAWLTAESDFVLPGTTTAADVTVRLYGDGVLLKSSPTATSTAVLKDRNPVRLPPGRYLEWEIEVESKAQWNALTIASTTQELQGV